MHKKVSIKIIIKILLLLYVSLFMSCSENETNKKKNESQRYNYKNLNVSILLDLSDRISSKLNPEQAEKDIYIISYVIDAFKNYLNKKGVVQSDDKIKTIFYPSQNYYIYQEIADSLNIDFGRLEFKQRKIMFEKISQLYNDQLKKLYSFATKSKVYDGSDLFNYFKHRIVDDCISRDTNFINILVILTDGYIYHKNSMYNSGKRFSYLIPRAEHVRAFRNLENWEEVFDREDYGLIKLNNDLSNLYILVTEMNPSENSPKDFDILKKYWSKWFEEQNMKPDQYKILRTDLNTLNRDLIYNFFQKILEGEYDNK
ncbi:hypothetical protein [Rosettibacter firmus]|uniref:hypothetical protein n=1 Tax=Rosettibacter firmus TaxID=3111522 RepID=UPI00336C1C10